MEPTPTLFLRDMSVVLCLPDGAERRCDLSETHRVLGEGRLDGPRLEVGIALVEDGIMPMLDGMAHGSSLAVGSAPLLGVLELLPEAGGDAAPIALVESLFNDLADHASGSPVAWRHAMAPEAAALPLLVLREVMHHGGFSRVSMPATP